MLAIRSFTSFTFQSKFQAFFYLEVIHSDSKGVHDFSINGLILKVNQVHFLPDGLQGSLRAESSQICTNVPMGFIGYLQKTCREQFNN